MRSNEILRLQGVAIVAVLFVCLLLGCADNVNRPPRDINPPPPGTAFEPWPPDGSVGLGMSINFGWRCENPNTGPLRFAVLTGQDTLMESSLPTQQNRYLIPWERQRRAREMLYQIGQMQQAYRAQHNSYCLNGCFASANSPDAFSQIGIVIDTTDTYSYTMNSSTLTFTCTAVANLDSDTYNDVMTIDEQTNLVNSIADYVTPYTPGASYTWKVITYTSANDTFPGPVWHFTTSPDSADTNFIPIAPHDPIPSDGYRGVFPLSFFSWRCDDPDGDFLVYDIYLGPGDDLQLRFQCLTGFLFISPWRKQQIALTKIYEISLREQLYHDSAGTYSSDLRSLGVIYDEEDGYYYSISSDETTFVCTAMGDIDQDWDWDQWTIDQNNALIHVSEDCDIPFMLGTRYSWRIVARDTHGNVHEGPTWTFTTLSDTLGANQ
jgi:hypothetical protein